MARSSWFLRFLKSRSFTLTDRWPGLAAGYVADLELGLGVIVAMLAGRATEESMNSPPSFISEGWFLRRSERLVEPLRSQAPRSHISKRMGSVKRRIMMMWKPIRHW